MLILTSFFFFFIETLTKCCQSAVCNTFARYRTSEQQVGAGQGSGPFSQSYRLVS
jgi:hypothetical protein